MRRTNPHPWFARFNQLPKGEVNAIVAELAARWSLTLAERFPRTPGTPGNFVAPATRADGTPVVLKLSNYVDETRNELAALRLWNGTGAPRLLESDADLGAMLMERVIPGTMLVELQNDDEAVRISADVLRELWRPLPANHGLRSLESWLAAYDRNRAALQAGAGGFPKELFRRADALRRELLDSTTESVVLHGDIHHYNVLRGGHAGWLAIDPKGLFGDRHFDVCQFLRNPEAPISAPMNRRRLDLFSDALALDRRRLAQWALVHAVLDACWCFEDGEDWRPAIAYAEETLAY